MSGAHRACRHAFAIPGETGRWVTRARPKVARIAWPWLIRRLIDPDAEVLNVPPAEVLAVASARGATPFDIEGVAFGHVGPLCSFDAFIRLYAITDKPLDCMALVVRGADTGRSEIATESPMLLVASRHLSQQFSDDYEMLERGIVVYDALYAWCRCNTRCVTEPWAQLAARRIVCFGDRSGRLPCCRNPTLFAK